jgi:cell division septal protein FtsQ
MWGKKRNRRQGRYRLLEVELPVGKARRRRVKMIVRWAGGLLGVAALFLGVWHGGAWVMRVGFYENEIFTVKTIDVRVRGILQPAQLQKMAGVQTSENLFRVDLMRVKRDLELTPLIETAAVERVLPDTLRLRIVERRPIAQVVGYRQQADGKLARQVYWLDARGVVIPPIAPGLTVQKKQPKWLPLIVGIPPAKLLPGRTVDSPALRSALQLVSRYDLSPMAGLAHLRQIDVSDSRTLGVVTWQGARVTLGLNGLDAQLQRWRQIHDLGRQHHRAVATVDLSIKNNLPVRWMQTHTRPAGG